MATAAQILNLANGSGNNEYNLGVGFDSGHTDITPSSLYGGWSDSYYFFPKPDNSAVVFRMKVTGGRTSSNTKYPRCELREMAALTNSGSNDPKAAWNGGSGTHWMRGKTKITHVTEMKPWICFAQIHNGGSDVIRLQTEGTSASSLKLVARHTPPGGSEVVTTIQSSYTVGQVIDWKIECINGTIKVYLGGVVKYTGNGNYTGCYFKSGLYLQSSVNNVNNTEGGDTSEYAELEMYDFMTWHTGQPNPAATYYEVNGGGSGGGGSTIPTSVNAGSDATINIGSAFTRTATEVGTAAITSRKWTIMSAPAGTGGSTIDNTQAAHRQGWGDANATWSDDFNYGSTGSPAVPTTSKWSLYQGTGHNENGTRDAARCRVHGDRLIIEGQAGGSTGGMSHKLDQQYGKWECRARSYGTATSNGNDYHPVLIIWPESGQWPGDGEYDFAENSKPGDNKYQAYIHFPHDADVAVQQRQFTKTGVDLTQWHNFAIEWTSSYIRGYFDGEMVFETSGGANADRRDIQTMPSGHLTIQLDNFDGTSQTPAKFEVDWVKIYPLVPVGSGPGGGGTTVGTQVGTAAALNWTPPAKGAYTLRYEVTTAQGNFFDDVVVNVVETGGGTPTSGTIGKTTAGASSSASTAVKAAISKFTSSVAGTLKTGHAHVWMTAGSTATKMIVIADSAGTPGSLLAESDLKTISNTTDVTQDYVFSGANEIVMSDATDYWIGVAWNDPGTDSLTIGRDNTAAQRKEVQSFLWPTVPSPFGPGTDLSGPMAVWVDVEAPTGGGSTPSLPPQFKSISSGKSGSSASITMDTVGAASGEMDVVAILSSGGETITAVPAGWQLMDTIQGAGPTGAPGGPYTGWLYYSTGGVGSATWSKSGTRFWHAVRGVWKGQHGLGDHQVRAEASGSGGTSHATPPVTTINPNSVVVGICMQDLQLEDPGPYTSPPAWTERYDATMSAVDEREAIAIADFVATSPAQVTGSFVGSKSDEAIIFSFVLEAPPPTGGGSGGTDPGSYTGGSGGPLTDRTSVSYNNGVKTSTYHIYAAGLDWSKQVGLLVYGDGSGEFGLANPSNTYLLAGTNGLIAKAKAHNMVLVTPRAPGNGCTDGDGVCWYLPSNDGTTRAQKTKWLDDLIKTQVLPLYDIDKTRVCLAGFSSGAENVAGIYGPLYAASWMEDGLLLAISYGSSPDQYGITDTYTSDFRAKVAAVWDVRGGDTTTALADSLEGYNWYGTEGFTTRERNVIPGGEHDRPGEFGTIVDGYLTEYVRASTTRAGGTSGTKLEAAQAILARLEDPLDAGDFFEDWTYDGMPAVVGEWNDELLADYEAATGPYEFPGDIESGQVQAWLQSFIDAQTGGGGGDPGPVGSPTISAGADVTLSVGEEFTRIATEEDNGAAITSRSWSITSGPAGVGTTMSLTATVTWQFTKPGTYVVAYQATNSLGTAVDTATITVTAAGAGSGHWPKTSGWFTLQR